MYLKAFWKLKEYRKKFRPETRFQSFYFVLKYSSFFIQSVVLNRLLLTRCCGPPLCSPMLIDMATCMVPPRIKARTRSQFQQLSFCSNQKAQIPGGRSKKNFTGFNKSPCTILSHKVTFFTLEYHVLNIYIFF